jgi:hypothetical protein
MELKSKSWTNGDRIPGRFAAGQLQDDGSVVFSDNLNPHLAWGDLPPGTQSMVLICHDFDVPSVGDDVNLPDRELAVDMPRMDFFHWVLIDLPPQPTVIEEGEFSRGFTVGGKPGPQAPHGARQGLNDYTGWFAGDPKLAGKYFGYDGPYPPFNDALGGRRRLHRARRSRGTGRACAGRGHVLRHLHAESAVDRGVVSRRGAA